MTIDEYLNRATTVTHAPESIGGCPVFLPAMTDEHGNPLVHEWVTDRAVLHEVDCPVCLRKVQSLNERGIADPWFVAAGAAVMLLIVLVLLAFGAHPAEAAQPYGGCKEAWQAPRSAGADECRDKGWTVRARLAVNPNGRVKYLAPSLPPCVTEDSRNCWWDADTMGNGVGSDFVNLGGRIIKVKEVRS